VSNGLPGINGSLGVCAVCGENFLRDILTNAKIKTFELDGVNGTLCAHEKCFPLLKDGMDVLTLPEESPIRQAFTRHNSQTEGGRDE
jgi:hypothetical protein